ncbi:MAG: tRNA (cytidine(34)-2'-O)-methyltransferase [Nitrospirae bacterium]|nr:tRNA (cytidine(34)-2'-O)-methyltransferase [Nitrospirota bacterium]
MNIVLVTPEIPPNAGNVARLCVSVGAALHLVKPLGFEISDRHLRRAGLDYWEHLELTVHADLDALLAAVGTDPLRLATTHATRPYTQVAYTARDWLVFGSETGGLPEGFVARFPEHGIRIPMWGPSRCLNLSNAVAVVAFEALRQVRAADFYGVPA